MQISAQISLYPLKPQRLSRTIEDAWRILEENRLDLKKGGMSTEKGPLSMVVTFSNAPRFRWLDLYKEHMGRPRRILFQFFCLRANLFCGDPKPQRCPRSLI